MFERVLQLCLGLGLMDGKRVVGLRVLGVLEGFVGRVVLVLFEVQVWQSEMVQRV